MTEVPQGIAMKMRSPSPLPGRLHAVQFSAAIAQILRRSGGVPVLTVSTWPYTSDDAFITFRYAENLSSGWGLSFKPGPLPTSRATRRRRGRSSWWASHALGIDAVLFLNSWARR